jgi:hypothetical protein
VHYFVEIETDLGAFQTDETVGTVKRTPDDCTVIGALPAASLGQKGSTRVYKYKARKPVG